MALLEQPRGEVQGEGAVLTPARRRVLQQLERALVVLALPRDASEFKGLVRRSHALGRLGGLAAAAAGVARAVAEVFARGPAAQLLVGVAARSPALAPVPALPEVHGALYISFEGTP